MLRSSVVPVTGSSDAPRPGEGRPPGLALAAWPRGRQRLPGKRDLAGAFILALPPVLVVLPASVTLWLEGPAPYPCAARPPAWNAAASSGVSGGEAASLLIMAGAARRGRGCCGPGGGGGRW